uniref:Uncharacterized protein n=1 Tax=Caenorhabditis japonica TaxID=281687 RepID=A0A8R1HN43_CAEJA
MKLKREKLREELNKLKLDGDNIKSEIGNQRKTQLDLEQDCRIRNKEHLETILAEHLKRYNTRNLSARDEQALVTEIDALKRNRQKLESLAQLNTERKGMVEKLEKNREQKHNVYCEIIAHQTQYRQMKQDRRHVEDDIKILNRQLHDVRERRKELINEYDSSREEYKAWLIDNKDKFNSVPMSFPTARKTKTLIEVEELEPYYEQKRDCNRLIHYLERFNITSDEVSKPSAPAIIDDDDDSADELPPYLLVKQNSKIPIASVPATNPGTKRSLKKANQPISHNIDIYKLFGVVDVEVPKLYSDIGASLAAVREKLEFYNQQTTNELDWGEDLGGMELLSVSRTASDMDSCLEDSMSDVGSMSSSFFRAPSRTSCPSPLVNDNSPRKLVAPFPPPDIKDTPV